MGVIKIGGDVLSNLIYLLVGFVVGAIIVYLTKKFYISSQINSANAKIKEMLKKAEDDASNIKKKAEIEAKDQLVELKKELEKRFQKETREKRDELTKYEQRINAKETKNDRRADQLEKREKDITIKEQSIDALKVDIENVKKEQISKLEQISGLSTNEARTQILSSVELELQAEIAKKVKKSEEEAKELADRKAKWIIATAVGRCAIDHNVDSMITVVNLPDEDMKGRIIGREGRNIRTLESLTGISIIIDDTPQAVVLSGFNSIKREIARLSLEKLIHDGRIHPARIEEVVAKTTAEIDQTIHEIGERTAIELGVQGLHTELIQMIGKLHYRTSYGQNQLQHTIEVAKLAAAMAGELGVDIQLAKRSGLLHDIGKVMTNEVEGSHAAIGADIARKYGEPMKVVNAILAHHEECVPETVESVIVAAADAISAAREGARFETIEAYIKRVETLERIAKSNEAVVAAYALQAGREIRVIVKPEAADDSTCAKLARDIRMRIEKEMEFPGQIKVVVIRETRAIDYAK
ncbi:MAG: ribonuclease Y [Candidatus Wallbacteria bacterium]